MGTRILQRYPGSFKAPRPEARAISRYGSACELPLASLSNVDMALGIEAGLYVVLIAIVLDRSDGRFDFASAAVTW